MSNNNLTACPESWVRCNSGRIEQECFGLYHPGLRQQRQALILQELRKMHPGNIRLQRQELQLVLERQYSRSKSRGNKYPTLNTKGLEWPLDDGYMDEEDEKEILRRLIEKNARTPTSLHDTDVQQSEESEPQFTDDDFPETFLLLSAQRSGASAYNDEWSLLSDDDVASQWTMASDAPGTYLGAALSSAARETPQPSRHIQPIPAIRQRAGPKSPPQFELVDDSASDWPVPVVSSSTKTTGNWQHRPRRYRPANF